MKKTLATSLMLLLTTSPVALAQVEMTGSPDELREILHPSANIVRLDASAEKTAYTDKAIIELMVSTEEDLLSDSLTKNAELRQKLTDELVKAGIDSESIKSAKFASSPEYGFWGKKPSSYRVNNRVSVSVMEADHIQAVATIADKYKEVELVNTTFEHTEKEAFEKAVKEEVMQKIMAEKASYEKILGLTLTPISINNMRVYSSGSQSAMMYQQRSMATEKMAMEDVSANEMVVSESVQSAPASFDELKYFANIYVDFEVSKASAPSSSTSN